MIKVGILGGGQLGWMTVLEGQKLGFEFLVLEDKKDAPAGRVAPLYPTEKLDEFYAKADLITWEFEHLPDALLEKVADKLASPPEALFIKKSRVREKLFLRKLGLPLPRFEIASAKELPEAVESVGLPAVVKAEHLGYDGKGQYRVKTLSELKRILANHPPNARFVVEELVDFLAETSCVAVIPAEGEPLCYPMPYNYHLEGILYYNFVPFTERPEALNYALTVARALNFVGVLTVEFFLTKEGKLLVNEFAPRVHNTGHWTLDGAYTSQFENHLRAIT
ncbi:MAG: ATP-grasp domain-containing protein, partial [Aquificae bacterium]|nr:ATP-grasp domain-containing protein [Aquificota bacterium]